MTISGDIIGGIGGIINLFITILKWSLILGVGVVMIFAIRNLTINLKEYREEKKRREEFERRLESLRNG